jgi:CheY-like chemotaxis protein
MNKPNSIESHDSKKNIKWYTYVDSSLNNKLKNFMKQFNISKQAEIIRDSVNSYIDFVRQIYQSEVDPIKYDKNYIDQIISNAIDSFEIDPTFYEELKQKLSPLKTLILMQESYVRKHDKLIENIENAKKAIVELESVIKLHFEEPNLIRHFKKFDILHVEDNELDRNTIAAYFKEKNVDIKSVETSEEGLKIIKKSTPNVILLDIDLKTSKINGDRLCKHLKSNRDYKDIPIILMTAVVSENEKKSILEKTGAEDIIIKPIDTLADLDLVFQYMK